MHLKALRGDFKYLLDVPNVVWNAVNGVNALA